MMGESSRPRLAGIRPAPLCREDDRRSHKMLMASSLPSLARLGMFKSANDAKSRFIHKHMKAATALAQASPEGGVAGMGTPLPRHWGGPPECPRVKVSEPLAVMATEAALEDFRRSKTTEKKRGHSGRERWKRDSPGRQRRSGASTCTTGRKAMLLQQSQSDGQIRYDRKKHSQNHYSQHHHHNSHRHRQQHQNQNQHQQQQQYRPPSTHAVILPQGGGLVLIGEDGVRKSKFPRGCERVSGWEVGAAGKRADGAPQHCNAGSGGEEDVLTRLCNPKNFTGTAATGQLPTVVDLEGGVGVLLKGDSTALKDSIGAEEVSWRLRLAERL